LLGAVFGLAFLIGPILGGLLLPFGWKWLFLINLPIAAVLIWGAFALLQPGSDRRDVKPIDWSGGLLLSIGLTALAVAVTNFNSAAVIASLTSVNVWPWLLCFVVLAPIYWRIEKQAADPIIRPAFFTNDQIRLTTIISFGVGAMESGTIFFPLLAVSAMGVSDSVAAWLLLPGVLATTIASPVIGTVVHKLGSRLIVSLGLLCLLIGLLMYGLLTITITVFIIGGVIAGLGFAAALGAPLRMVLLNEAPPEDRTAAQGLLNVFLAIGQLLGAAIVGGVAASRGGGTAGYQTALVVLAVITAALFFFALKLKSRAAEAETAANAAKVDATVAV
jgi:MFS family permease